ncbi:MAG: hypothetical protein LUC38_06015 [Oscillospiraceae bacterium]|nr:hypothetical protein [Oscillospiraceae bacterium]
MSRQARAENKSSCDRTIEFLYPILSVTIPAGTSPAKITTDSIASSKRNSETVIPA